MVKKNFGRENARSGVVESELSKQMEVEEQQYMAAVAPDIKIHVCI